MRLTKKQKKEYLKDSVKCPLCKSDRISGGEWEVSVDVAYQYCNCQNCGARWYDKYKMIDVELDD